MVRILGSLFVAVTLAGAVLSSAIATPVKRDAVLVQADVTAVVSDCNTLNSVITGLDKTKPASASAIANLIAIVSTVNSACSKTTTDAKAVASFTTAEATELVGTVTTLVEVLTDIVSDLALDVVVFSTSSGHQAVCSSLNSLTLNVITMVGAIATGCPTTQKNSLLGFVSANATLTLDLGSTAKALGC